MKLLRFLVLALAGAVPPLLSFAQAPSDPAARTFALRLDNGLSVIVKEDHRAPTAVHMVWYRTGSIDEKDGLSGVAHVLEHLMFKATTRLKSGEFSRRVAAAGGRDNAFTGNDYTAYFQIVPKAALPQMMQMEAERMRNLKFDAKEFAAEIRVVMEERRWRTEDKPEAKTHEALLSSAFTVHPYRRPVIGWMSDLEAMRWQDARDWYRQWYAPNNATVVVAGDVDHRAVFALAKKYYGAAKAMPLHRPRIASEPPQTGLRRINVKAPAKIPYLSMAWKVPALRDVDRDSEPYALEMLAAVLDGHAAARLGRELVRERRVAQSVGASYDGVVRGDALFILDGQSAQGHSIDELEKALRDSLERIRKDGISEEEMARVRVQAIAAQTYKRDSLMAQAMEIGALEVSGYNWRDNERMLEKLKSVSAAQVQAVAQKYFSDDSLTVATLDPQEPDPNAAPVPRPALSHQ